MILHGSKSFEAGHVSGLFGAGQVQPCGIDMTLGKIEGFADSGEIDFDNSKRRISGAVAIDFDEEGRVELAPGCYRITYNEYVSVPLDCCALGFPRSSLLRCGADVRCAVWDPGYHGRSESLLVVANPHGITLHRNAKVMQLVFVKLEGGAVTKGYEGRYRGENR